MFTGITHNLGGGIKPHRLGIEQGRAEHIRIVAFDPAGHVDQMRETGGVAFGEAVITETFDLIETTASKFRIIAAADHPADHLFLKLPDCTARPERRHRLAELVRFIGRKLCRHHSDLHRLLLENRDALGPLQDLAQLIRVICWAR